MRPETVNPELLARLDECRAHHFIVRDNCGDTVGDWRTCRLCRYVWCVSRGDPENHRDNCPARPWESRFTCVLCGALKPAPCACEVSR